MKPEKIDELRTEIQKVASRHGVKNWSFCGDDSTAFVGFVQPKNTQGGTMLAIINAGRLWQYARQTCRGLLDSFERMP